MRRWFAYALLAATWLACGGRASVVGGADASSGDDGGDGLVFASCAPGGVRLCGGNCGDVPSCPGAGCTGLIAGSGTAASFGVCWADLADMGLTPCALCDDGQGCVQRSSGSFVCVPLAVCGALDALGAGEVCWYGDKVPFDGAAVASATGCPQPTGIANVVCGGGDCPPCADITLDRCVGRGPDHPFGVCPPMVSPGSRVDLSNVPLCIVSGGSDALACPALSSDYSYSCAVYPYPPAPPTVAPRNGFCISDMVCKELAASLPGGLWCFDATGRRVAP